MSSGEGGVTGGGKGDDGRPDVVEESLRVAEGAERRGLVLRLLGGVAVRVRAGGGLHPAFRREYAGLDRMVPRGRSEGAGRLFESSGYMPHFRFDAIGGRERLFLFDEARGSTLSVGEEIYAIEGSRNVSRQPPFCP